METNTNILNYGDIERLAIKYNVPIVDVLLMALNRYGICANLEDKRIRFKLRPILTNEVYYLAICVNTFNSPFTIDDRNQLILDGMGVGQIEYYGSNVPLFRRNGYRQSGTMIP